MSHTNPANHQTTNAMMDTFTKMNQLKSKLEASTSNIDGGVTPAMGNNLISQSMQSLVQNTVSTPASKHSRADKDVRFEKTPDKTRS